MRIISFLLLLIVLFIGVEFLVTKLTKEYIVKYIVFSNDKEATIKEMYQSNMNNIYDLEITPD